MKLLFLSKRRPQQRDLIHRPYGRFHHLPACLAARGHDVRVVLIGHHALPQVRMQAAGITTIALDLREQGWTRVQSELRNTALEFSPDWVVGCSDAWLGWLAHRVAKSCNARLAIDAYDNYEAYMPWNLPLHFLWRRAVKEADLVTVAGPQLAERLDAHRRGKRSALIVPMAADPAFQPMDQGLCRQQLGLPGTAPLLGYYGGWAAARGTDLLIAAYRLVQASLPSARLVLTGKPPGQVLSLPGVFPLGYLDDSLLPFMVNSLDAACVLTADTGFGRFSYPAKLCEAMACGIAVCATDTAPVRWMLGDSTQCLAPVGDATAFAGAALRSLVAGRMDYGPLPTWQDGARIMESGLESVA